MWNANQNADERIGARLPDHRQDPGALCRRSSRATSAPSRSWRRRRRATRSARRRRQLTLPPISFPNPSYSVAVSPKTKADLDKMGTALNRIVEEDPSLRLERNPATGRDDPLRAGRLARRGGAGEDPAQVRRRAGDCTCRACRTARPVRGKAQAEYTHKKQTGGHGQYARVALEVEPLPRGAGVEFVDKIVGGVGAEAVHRLGREGSDRGDHTRGCWRTSRWWTRG